MSSYEARQALDSLPGLTWAPWSACDLPDISSMLTAVEAADQPSERHSLQELKEDFASRNYDLNRDCLLARGQDRSVVAIARSVCTDSDRAVRRALLAGAVRPDRRGQGIGRALMTWQLAHARQWFRDNHQPEHRTLRISLFADSLATREHRLAERFGLPRARYYAELTRNLPSEPILVADSPGIRVQPWRSVPPEHTLSVRNAAFADHWGSVERTPDSWQEQLNSSMFQPDWSFVALDEATGQAVAFLMSSAYEQDWEPQGYTGGYVELLGTLRAYRGRGIATALLHRAMRAYQTAGLQAAEIGVDSENPSGAFGLYTSLGFQETSATVQFMREESAREDGLTDRRGSAPPARQQ